MGTNKTMTSEIVEYLHHLTYEGIPPEVRQELRRCLLDGFAVMLAGSQAACAQVVHRYIEEGRMPGKATVLGTSLTTSASLAALANGVAGHADDYDDTQLSSSPDRTYGLLTHPTVPALAATLAVGQQVGATGREFLTALCAGSEVECKMAEAIDPSHYLRGFHTTGTIGIFAAAAGAAKLLGLSPEQTRHALGIAASKSAGIRVNFGTMTKPYHAGAAAENGVTAALLAKLGYQADPNALDGRWGFFQVAGGGCDPARLVGKLGNPYTLQRPGVSVKPYPCGSLAHPSMDALLDLVREHDIRPGQVEEVRLGAGSNILNPLRYQEPQNELEAKFSLPFCLAILVLRRRAGLQEFTPEVVLSRPVREMMKRVRTYHSPEIEAKGGDRIRSRVEVRLKDGRTLVREAETSRGTPERPMSREELEGKFTDCAQRLLTQERTRAALAAIHRVEEMPSLDDLAGLFVR
ncbi:MAG: MmgE/PrpD family protein [Chloroflexi bacterium]|nr:MmgE/PrpD family protein [Chloroflexota bacterium]